MEPWLQQIFDRLTQHNPGALSVFFRLADAFKEEGTAIFDCGVLIGMGIVGQDVYILFVQCNRNIQEFHQALMEERAVEIVKAVPGSNLWKKAQAQALEMQDTPLSVDPDDYPVV